MAPKYRTDGKEKRPWLGVYPGVTIKAARDAADDARKLLTQGIDPSSQRKKTAPSKPSSVLLMNGKNAAFRQRTALGPLPASGTPPAKTSAPKYGEKIMDRLESDVFPYIGRQSIATLTPPQLLAAMRRIESRGVIETAHRALENCGQVFRYAVTTGRVESNPARDLRGALKKPLVKHFPAITDPKRLGELLRASEGYKGSHIVRAALHLTPLVLLRPGELRQATWKEIDLDRAVWTVPAARMKRTKAGKLHGKPDIVPLSAQAVQKLRDLHSLTGNSHYVFCGERHHERPMSDATVNAALRAMGFAADEVTGHGFRATARTMMVERPDIPEPLIEAQLAHSVKDSLGRAYNRTEFSDERAKMMQLWADYLDRLRVG